MRVLTRFSRLLLGLLLLGTAWILLAACGGSGPPTPAPPVASGETVAPSPASTGSAPTQPPEATATAAPTQAVPAETQSPPTPTAQPVVQDWSQHAYREGDLFFLGNPDAPIRLIDYSDFL